MSDEFKVKPFWSDKYKNPYFDKYGFKDVHVVDDSKYYLKGSEKQYTHLCTVIFRNEHFVCFCEASQLLEWQNRKNLGEKNWEYLIDANFLKPKVYIERVRMMPGRGDTINTYLMKINEDNLFYFLLEYFKCSGILKEMEIKGNLTGSVLPKEKK